MEKNTKIRDDHEKNVLAPYVNKLLSSLKLKTPGTSKKLILYKERQISSEDGKIYITLETNDKKTTFKKTNARIAKVKSKKLSSVVSRKATTKKKVAIIESRPFAPSTIFPAFIKPTTITKLPNPKKSVLFRPDSRSLSKNSSVMRDESI